ncbi:MULTISPECIES: GGDEF domain-containing protein [unclassified Guyparkeria]|uniref:GGDEF domain-containing protein n=1 Tax=unclassified Guyparkeria TaxID=2626246 RepID=UPI0007337787|nr:MULTISPECIES: GGDEF domain-containing protein [unclassified Guyparkeria]KTG16488.1 hypothetical protein AUR63_03825 [Guyparkeria sp. XI15]OAE85428.1 hypothetical protein AWR35_03835 [Guyparkeria sp. WRN-7]
MRHVNKTLLEQMQMSDAEISRRMELLGLTDQDLRCLTSKKQLIEGLVDGVVGEFYDRQTDIDEIALLIGDADTLHRLRRAQRRYVLDLFAGDYGPEYVNNRLRIGMVHKRIGVEPKLYLSALRTLKELIIQALTASIRDADDLAATLRALDKLLYFDTTLVFDTYIDSLVGEIEAAKRRMEDYATSLEEKVARRTAQLEEQAKLDPLTGVYNLRAMQDVLVREMELARRRRGMTSVVYIDIDDFKQINDQYGHLHGDDVLKDLGWALSECLRSTDIPFRYGGDEFCALLPDCGIADARAICDKVIDSFRKPNPEVSLSVGVAETRHDDCYEWEALIDIADERMYGAKKQEGCCVQEE